MSKRTYKLGLFGLLILFLLLTSAAIKEPSTNLIWKGDSHAAFTSLVYYNNYLYCAFRNANQHADTNGKDNGCICIIRSKDGDVWESFLRFENQDFDFRDPQMSVTPSGELMLLTEKVQYNEGHAKTRSTAVTFIKEDGSFTPISSIHFDTYDNWNWIWNIEWIDGVAYGFCYIPFFGLVRSEDGINYELVEKIHLDGNPSEASVAKLDKNHLLAVVRRDSLAALGIYNLIDKQWQWRDCDEIIACPKIIKAKKNLFVVGRSYKYGLQTTLYKFNKNKQELVPIERIQGDKDCSYPGIVYINRKFCISYYKGDAQSSNIYLTSLKY